VNNGGNITPGLYVVALTGGIASGKSTVADLFAKLGVPIIDTDVIARQVVQPGSSGLAKVTAAFGEGVLKSNGSLDRKKMRQLVFSDPRLRQKLESILHPIILSMTLQNIRDCHAVYCIVVIPLLAESGVQPWVNHVLVVDVTEQIQLDRLMQRDQISQQQANAMLAAQASREARLGLADDVLSNTGALEELAEMIFKLHSQYIRLAADKTNGQDFHR